MKTLPIFLSALFAFTAVCAQEPTSSSAELVVTDSTSFSTKLEETDSTSFSTKLDGTDSTSFSTKSKESDETNKTDQPSSVSESVPTSPPVSTSPPAPSPAEIFYVAHMNTTQLFVAWKWEGNVGLEAASFRIIATPSDETNVNVTEVFVDGKLFGVLDGLNAGTKYDITVVTEINNNGATSPSDKVTVATRTEEFDTPTNVTSKYGDRQDMNTVPYSTTWTFEEDGATNLKNFVVFYCTTYCEAETHPANEFQSEKILDYYTDYTVLVMAVPKDTSTEKTPVVSAPEVFKSVQGRPGPVEHLNAVQTPDTLDLVVTWSIPNAPRGKIVSYSVEITENGTSIVTGSVTGATYTYTIRKEEEIADSYKITVQAVNDGDDEIKKGTIEVRSVDLDTPAAPTKLTLKTSARDSLDIEIATRNPSAPLSFEVTYSGKKNEIDSGNIVKLGGFQTYEEVNVSVKSCVGLENQKYYCGDSKDETFRTNVGPPSAVKNLKLSEDAKSLSWEEPDTPAGPLNGYIVKIADKTKKEDSTEEAQTPTFTLKESKNCTEYAFTVHAFNLDANTQEKVEGEASNSVTLKTEHCDEAAKEGGFPAWAIVLIVLAILGAAGGGAFYMLKVRRSR